MTPWRTGAYTEREGQKFYDEDLGSAPARPSSSGGGGSSMDSGFSSFMSSIGSGMPDFGGNARPRITPATTGFHTMGPFGGSKYLDTLRSNTGGLPSQRAGILMGAGSGWDTLGATGPTSAQIGALTQSQMAFDQQKEMLGLQSRAEMEKWKMQMAMEAWQERERAEEAERNRRAQMVMQSRGFRHDDYSQAQDQFNRVGL